MYTTKTASSSVTSRVILDMYFEKGMELFRHVTLKSSTATSKVVIVEMFLEEGEINPAYPFLVTVMINPCFNEAKNTFFGVLSELDSFGFANN